MLPEIEFKKMADIATDRELKLTTPLFAKEGSQYGYGHYMGRICKLSIERTEAGVLSLLVSTDGEDVNDWDANLLLTMKEIAEQEGLVEGEYIDFDLINSYSRNNLLESSADRQIERFVCLDRKVFFSTKHACKDGYLFPVIGFKKFKEEWIASGAFYSRYSQKYIKMREEFENKSITEIQEKIDELERLKTFKIQKKIDELERYGEWR